MTMSNTQKLRLQRSPEYAHSPTASTCADKDTQAVAFSKVHDLNWIVRMILPQVHLRKPCYDFSFLSDKVHETFQRNVQKLSIASVRIIHRITQSVGATGGVYKGQGCNQHELMTRAY